MCFKKILGGKGEDCNASRVWSHLRVCHSMNYSAEFKCFRFLYFRKQDRKFNYIFDSNRSPNFAQDSRSRGTRKICERKIYCD